MKSSSTLHSFFRQFSDPMLIHSALSWLSIDGESSCSFLFVLFPCETFIFCMFFFYISHQLSSTSLTPPTTTSLSKKKKNKQFLIVVHIFPDQSRWMTRRRTKWWGRFFVKKKFGWSAASVCLKRVQTPVNSHCRRHHGCLCFVATCERLQLPRSCIDTSRRLRHHRVEDKVAEEVHQLPPSSPLWREREKWWSKVIQAIE